MVPDSWPPAISAADALGVRDVAAGIVARREPSDAARPESVAPVELGDPDQEDDTADEWRLEDVEEIRDAARTRRAPFRVAAITAVVGYGAWGVGRVAEVFGGVDAATTVGAGACVVTALSLPILRAAFRHQIPEEWSRRWWLSTSLCAAWVDVAAAQGSAAPGWVAGTAAALVVGTGILGAGWFDEHEVPHPDDVWEEEPTPRAPVRLAAAPRLPQIDTSQAGQIERDWLAHVAGGPQPMAAGSKLEHCEHLPHGYRWIIRLDPHGTVGATKVTAPDFVTTLALRFQMNPAFILIERLAGEGNREDLAVLTILTSNALALDVPFGGHVYSGGAIPFALHGEGSVKAAWTMKDVAGPHAGVVIGGPRSGKSWALTKLGMACKASSEWTVIFTDGDEHGRSSPLLKRIAYDAGWGVEDALRQLEAVESWARYRGSIMGGLFEQADGTAAWKVHDAQQTANKILPCRAFPGLVWIFDEFHLLAKSDWLRQHGFVGRVARVRRLLAKLGCTLIIGTHSSYGGDFGGDAAFRDTMSQNNVLTLKSGSKGEAVGDSGFNLNDLPDGGGYGYFHDGLRTAPLRTESPFRTAEEIEYWLSLLPGDAIDDESEQAYRRYRPVRVVDPASEYRDSVRSRAEYQHAHATGAPLPGSPEAKRAAEDAERASAKEASADAPAPAREPEFASVSICGVDVPLPSNVTPIRSRPAVESASPPSRPDRPAMTPKAKRVLAYLRLLNGDATSPGQIGRDLELSPKAVSEALKVLLGRGEAHRPHGVQSTVAACSAEDWAPSA